VGSGGITGLGLLDEVKGRDVHRGGSTRGVTMLGRRKDKRTIRHLPWQKIAIKGVIGKKPATVDQVARRANNRRASARDESDAQTLGRHILKAGIVGHKDVEHKRT